MRIFVQNKPADNKVLWVEIDGEVSFVDLLSRKISRSLTLLNGLNCDNNITEITPDHDQPPKT